MSLRLLAVLTVMLIGLMGCGGMQAAPDPVADLLAQHGWKPAGPRVEGENRLPEDFRFRTGFPWRLVVDYSLDIGFDLEAYAGEAVRTVNLPVEDLRGRKFEQLSPDTYFQAWVLLDMESGRPIGAYLMTASKDGELLVGGPGPSLSGRDLEAITGLSFPEYVQKYRAEEPSPARLEAEAPQNAIYQYFRAASAHDCEGVWSRLAEGVRSASDRQAWCRQYEPLASLRVIEILGYIKADTPQGFRFADADEVADEYYVIVGVKHKPEQRSAWQEGLNRLLIPMVRERDGQWRLGPARSAPAY